MRREGHFLDSVWFKGEWSDEYLYAVLKDEWLRMRAD
jgi:RimJ/RimL family protein N-acetyltransferase